MSRWGAALLAVTCLLPAGVAAQTWVGTTGSFVTSSNWSPATVPSGAGATAIFANTGVTSVTNASGTIGGLQFNSNAQSYTIDLGFLGLTLASTGIVNNSSVPQTITSSLSGILQINAGSAANMNISAGTANVIFAGTATAAPPLSRTFPT